MLMFKTKNENGLSNVINQYGCFFENQLRASELGAYVRKLNENGHDYKDVEKAFDILIRVHERFPSFAAISKMVAKVVSVEMEREDSRKICQECFLMPKAKDSNVCTECGGE